MSDFAYHMEALRKARVLERKCQSQSRSGVRQVRHVYFLGSLIFFKVTLFSRNLWRASILSNLLFSPQYFSQVGMIITIQMILMPINLDTKWITETQIGIYNFLLYFIIYIYI